MKLLLAIAILLLVAAGCGGSDGGETITRSAPAAPEASPEAPPSGPEVSGDVPDPDRAAIAGAVHDYVDALDRRDARAVCAAFAPGAIELDELPTARGDCAASLAASIGAKARGGAPAWRNTKLIDPKSAELGDDRARVTATVKHHFSDRSYVSVEDDVIYLELADDRWLLAKPSATFYRAVGYPDPPLRSLSPPPGW